MTVSHKSGAATNFVILNGTPPFLMAFLDSSSNSKATLCWCLAFKIYCFRVILENSKILTAAGSHGNRSHTLTTTNSGIGLLGLQEDIMSVLPLLHYYLLNHWYFILERYSNEVVFDLFVIFGENNKIVNKTCREFNLKYPDLPQMTKGKFHRLRNCKNYTPATICAEKIIWTDEAKFNQKGVFNQKNQHFWAYENPHLVIQVENQIQFNVNGFCLIMDDQFRYFMTS
ncbi:hypothetical protein ABEB36_009263 [Hypothenemus hampei]|uniref:DUF4817 domain-containing protein n=1 Tax=Hypothenemus hampei TaxID=57062 RepID=A0ABD1EFT7_HYPHA